MWTKHLKKFLIGTITSSFWNPENAFRPPDPIFLFFVEIYFCMTGKVAVNHVTELDKGPYASSEDNIFQ